MYLYTFVCNIIYIKTVACKISDDTIRNYPRNNSHLLKFENVYLFVTLLT